MATVYWNKTNKLSKKVKQLKRIYNKFLLNLKKS